MLRRKGLSQEALAPAAEMERNYVSLIERSSQPEHSRHLEAMRGARRDSIRIFGRSGSPPWRARETNLCQRLATSD
nr:hypothetical protein [Burkholderia sp. Ax-1719]